MKKLWNLLIYAGLEQTEYNKLKDDIRKENLANFLLESAGCAIFFTILTIVALLSNNFAFKNFGIYLVCAGLSLIFFLLAKFKLVNDKSITVLMYLFMAVLYAFGIAVTINQPDYPSVTFIVLVMVIPLLFVDRPIRLICITTIATILFSILVYKFKVNTDIASKDLWNAISFACVAVLIECLIIRVKVKSISQNVKIKELSELDLLTGVKNRNSYELFLQNYANNNDSITCIFSDVNGLHEVNNTLGHNKGDEMLKCIAKTIESYFGKDYTFRAGGDEFIAFTFNAKDEEVYKKIEEINSIIKKENYNVSFGLYSMTKLNYNSTELIKYAEKEMYQAKAKYYSDNNIDRRCKNR